MVYNGRIKNRIRLLLGVLMLSLFLNACKGLELENKTEQVEGYSKEQSMILLANERNRYEKLYGPEVWSIRIGEEETSFDQLTIQNVKLFMEQMKLLCMLAEERGVTVSSRERDAIRQLVDRYMDSLTEGDLAYMGCTAEDVTRIYTDYYTAVKLTRLLTRDSGSEISDSEVKVIRIQQIATADEKKAKAILKRIKIDKAAFASMASRFTEAEEIEFTLQKTPSPGLFERTAFSLEEGQISNILCIEGMYYIIKCVDGYDEEATRERKSHLKTAIDAGVLKEVLDPYQAEHNIRFIEKFWSQTDFREESGSTADNFFDLYELAFSEGTL